ncbi:MAG: hypothetical protein Q8R37_03355 [Nanoarchaeota archaeon]|nr:hypothetical protein [Nanoarchaeota archaeon]
MVNDESTMVVDYNGRSYSITVGCLTSHDKVSFTDLTGELLSFCGLGFEFKPDERKEFNLYFSSQARLSLNHDQIKSLEIIIYHHNRILKNIKNYTTIREEL